MIPISYLVSEWGILIYSNYLVRVTAVFGSTADLADYSYEARLIFSHFGIGWLIIYQCMYVISNDTDTVFSISMKYIERVDVFIKS